MLSTSKLALLALAAASRPKAVRPPRRRLRNREIRGLCQHGASPKCSSDHLGEAEVAEIVDQAFPKVR